MLLFEQSGHVGSIWGWPMLPALLFLWHPRSMAGREAPRKSQELGRGARLKQARHSRQAAASSAHGNGAGAAWTDGYFLPRQPLCLIHRFAVPESLPFKGQQS